MAAVPRRLSTFVIGALAVNLFLLPVAVLDAWTDPLVAGSSPVVRLLLTFVTAGVGAAVGVVPAAALWGVIFAGGEHGWLVCRRHGVASALLTGTAVAALLAWLVTIGAFEAANTLPQVVGATPGEGEYLWCYLPVANALVALLVVPTETLALHLAGRGPRGQTDSL